MSNPAETYERFMVPPLFAPCAVRLLDLARPQSGERVLDVACGTGIVARGVARRAGAAARVTGLDLSPEMLTVARAASAAEGLTIDWREGRAEALPLPDQSFELTLCQFGLMFFADRGAALAEMHRVTTAGGRVAIHVFQGIEQHPFYQKLNEAIMHHLGASGVGDIFALGDASALLTSLEAAGFRDVTISPMSVTAQFPNPEQFLAGEIDVDTAAIPAMHHLDDAARRELVATIAAEMDGPLRAQTENGHVVIPFQTLVALAYR